MSVDFSSRWARAVVDTSAIRHNVAHIRTTVAPARVWAVVKANGYGHGSVEVAHAAIAGGAEGLCVALVDEAVVLRRAGVTAPILLLSEQPTDQAPYIVGYGLTPTVTTTMGAAAIGAAGAQQGRAVPVHVKVDTGMHRVGVAPREALHLARYVDSHDGLDLEGLYTHFAVADDPSHPANERQLAAFDEVVTAVRTDGIAPRIVHAANSAAALSAPATRFDMVRAGIAIYGIAPDPNMDEACAGLRPALSLVSRVSYVKRVEAGEAISYGHRHRFDRATNVATVPIGYADGVQRRLSAVGGAVLIGGVRRPIVGVVTMDQLMVDMGEDRCEIGDEVVLIGRQGDRSVNANEWGAALGTIGYEIVCGLSARLAREYLDEAQ